MQSIPVFFSSMQMLNCGYGLMMVPMDFSSLLPIVLLLSVPYAIVQGLRNCTGSIMDRCWHLLSMIFNSSIADGSVSKAKMDPNLVVICSLKFPQIHQPFRLFRDRTTLSVQADGKFLSYQWQKNGEYYGSKYSSLSLIIPVKVTMPITRL